jgi:hypothetical protein
MKNTEISWKKSSHSTSGSGCVEVALLPDGTTLMRDTKNPDGGTLSFTRAEMKAWIAGCVDGEFDDHT